MTKKGLSSRQMSGLYRKLKRNMGKRQAYKKVGELKRQSKWQNMGTTNRAKLRRYLKDTDKDGVPNKYDCEPYNKYKQDDLIKRGLLRAGTAITDKLGLVGLSGDMRSELASSYAKEATRKRRLEDEYIKNYQRNEKLRETVDKSKANLKSYITTRGTKPMLAKSDKKLTLKTYGTANELEETYNPKSQIKTTTRVKVATKPTLHGGLMSIKKPTKILTEQGRQIRKQLKNREIPYIKEADSAYWELKQKAENATTEERKRFYKKKLKQRIDTKGKSVYY